MENENKINQLKSIYGDKLVDDYLCAHAKLMVDFILEHSYKHTAIAKNAENYVKYGLGQAGVPARSKTSGDKE